MERATVILVLTCLVGALIVLPLKFLKDHAHGDSLAARTSSLAKRLDSVSSDRATPDDKVPSIADVLTMYRERPRLLKDGSRAFFEAHEVKSFAERAEATGEFRRMIFPPLELSGEVAVGAVNLVWVGNPRNDALGQKIGSDSLLTIGYQIYRWTKGGHPQVIAKTSLANTAFADDTIGSAKVEYFYSVLTVLEGRVGGAPTVIESERSNVLRVVTKEAFTLEVLRALQPDAGGGGAASAPVDGALVAVVVPTGEHSERREFLVRVGETIGAVAGVAPGVRQSFETGLKLVSVQEIEEEKAVDVARALFDPDGRRSLDNDGRPAFERGSRLARMRHVEIVTTDALGERRVFSSPAAVQGS
ncbi:MAG: hypothetical protein U1E76_08625 [Planctomycetota bacterium]